MIAAVSIATSQIHSRRPRACVPRTVNGTGQNYRREAAHLHDALQKHDYKGARGRSFFFLVWLNGLQVFEVCRPIISSNHLRSFKSLDLS